MLLLTLARCLPLPRHVICAAYMRCLFMMLAALRHVAFITRHADADAILCDAFLPSLILSHVSPLRRCCHAADMLLDGFRCRHFDAYAATLITLLRFYIADY